jgi:hypothetical protein
MTGAAFFFCPRSYRWAYSRSGAIGRHVLHTTWVTHVTARLACYHDLKYNDASYLTAFLLARVAGGLFCFLGGLRSIQDKLWRIDLDRLRSGHLIRRKAPSAPSLVSPSPSVLAQADSIVLTWRKSAPSVLRYLDVRSNDSLFATVATDSTTDTTFIWSGLVSNQTYFWRAACITIA